MLIELRSCPSYRLRGYRRRGVALLEGVEVPSFAVVLGRGEVQSLLGGHWDEFILLPSVFEFTC